jgi:hypothetical protein
MVLGYLFYSSLLIMYLHSQLAIFEFMITLRQCLQVQANMTPSTDTFIPNYA